MCQSFNIKSLNSSPDKAKVVNIDSCVFIKFSAWQFLPGYVEVSMFNVLAGM
jgi:hypothetical protein